MYEMLQAMYEDLEGLEPLPEVRFLNNFYTQCNSEFFLKIPSKSFHDSFSWYRSKQTTIHGSRERRNLAMTKKMSQRNEMPYLGEKFEPAKSVPDNIWLFQEKSKEGSRGGPSLHSLHIKWWVSWSSFSFSYLTISCNSSYHKMRRYKFKTFVCVILCWSSAKMEDYTAWNILRQNNLNYNLRHVVY